jgi:hypothetical protein
MRFCVFQYGLKRKLASSSKSSSHWLDAAKGKYDAKLVPFDKTFFLRLSRRDKIS